MSHLKSTGLMLLGVVFAQLLAAPAQAQVCKAIHADLVEVRTTEGCDPGLAFCFIGAINGNHGLRGVTHFRGDSGAAGPSTGLPGFISYSGPFQYRTAAGVLDVRETGVTNTSTGLPQSGAVTAYQQILGGTGEYEGATGFLFVSGRNTDGVIETRIFGELCFAQ
ncbi:MAG TPA: hypothetical protein VF267_04470 [Gammaproteobacteria bacterium]